jgi:hypothetical protein
MTNKTKKERANKMTWAQVKAEIAKSTTASDYIRLKDGESVIGVMVGEPTVRRVVFDEFAGRSEDYDPVKHADVFPTRKFLFDFAVAPDFSIAKKFEVGIKVIEQLNKLSDKGVLAKWSIEISRTGTSTKTVYTVTPSEQLTADDNKRINVLAAKLGKSAQKSDDDRPF